MKGLRLAFLAGILGLGLLPVEVAGMWNPLATRCNGVIEVSGEWLYLRPTGCEHDFVIKDPRTFDSTSQNSIAAFAAHLPVGTARQVNPDYESGFRVALGFLLDSCNRDLRVSYTYHHPCHSAHVLGQSNTCGLWPTYMHPRYAANVDGAGAVNAEAFETPLFSGTVSNTDIPACASSTIRLDYDAGDLQFGFRKCLNGNIAIRPYIGLHFMNLDDRHIACYQGVMYGNQVDAVVGAFATHVRWDKRTWGIGPLLGFDARYEIACGFGVGGQFGAAVLAGETDGTFTETDRRTWSGNNTPLDVDEVSDVCHGDRHHLFPFMRARLGVNYLWCCGSCFKLFVEFGYEFNSYINAIGQIRFDDQRATDTSNCYSYNLDGLYLSVRGIL